MVGIKHHLIDVLNPEDEFSAGIFVDLAKNAISDISAKGKLPIIVGGTGLYLKMLLDGFDMPKDEPNKELRTQLQSILEDKGVDFLYNMLVELDEEFAKKLHPNDTYKVMRSIEIIKNANKPMSQARGTREKEYDVLKIALGAKDRQFVYDRINSRVDKMIEMGLENEARTIYEKNPNLKSFYSTIGYQEFVPYFSNECDLKTVIEKIKQNTRRYAKRQLTWFRAQEDINWFYIDELSSEELELQVEKLCKSFI